MKKSKRSYNCVQQEQREALIKLVESDTRMTIKEAAIRLGINYSTAKHIIKSYSKTQQMPFATPLRIQEQEERIC